MSNSISNTINESVVESNPSSSQKAPALEWDHISISIKDKVILDNISGDIQAGELLALMGPSGSGKTTLLNYLSDRKGIKNGVELGQMLYQGAVIHNNLLPKISRYVEQEDHLIGSLTVFETVDYAGKLSGIKNKAFRHEKINEILEGLGLTKQRDVIVGTPLRKGLSGGQKRRLSIACELITMPRILFLDEPTSGLDSKASYEVISTIKEIAVRQNIMVIASIHQPSGSTFNLFDKVSFMTNGKMVYFGAIQDIKPYFNSHGIEFNENENLAEFILDLINTDFVNSDPELVRSLNEAWYRKMDLNTTEKFAIESPDSEPPQSSKILSQLAVSVNSCQPCYQTWVLLTRSFLKAYRDFLAYYVRIIMYLGLAVMMGTVWLRLGYDQDSIQPFINAIFFSGAFMSFMSVAYIPAFIEDYQSYRKEKLNGLYGAGPFVLSNFLISIPFLFVTTILFSVVTYFLCNFDENATGFWKYVMWLFFDLVAAESLTVLISTIFPYFVIALALTAFANGLWMSVGGFLVPENILNVFWYYTFYWIDYQRYVFQGMMFNQFENTVYSCGEGCNCMYVSELQDQCQIAGKAVLESVGYSDSDIGLWIGIIVVLVFVMRFASYIVLKFRH